MKLGTMWATGLFVVAMACPVSAGTLYVANGSTVQAWNTSSNSSFRTFTPSTSWTNAFALTVDASGNLYVADAGANRVVQFSSTGTELGVFSLPADTSGGNISPQEIALDASGNLYTTSFNGDIREYASSSGAGTTIQTISGARGITVAGDLTYVSTSSNGFATVSKFATGTANAAATTVLTTGDYSEGQLRGMVVDGTGNLYVADSTWVAGQGYVKKITPANVVTTLLTSLNGPNQLTIGPDGNLYVASYFGGDVKSYSLSGSFNSTVVSGQGNITGMAFAPSAVDSIARVTDAGTPAFFQPATALPEPGTWGMMVLALGTIALMGNSHRRRAVQAIRRDR